MRDEVTKGWRRLHNEELHNLYLSPNIIRMIKSRNMRQSLWHASYPDSGFHAFPLSVQVNARLISK
jgi:hypothetical protein